MTATSDQGIWRNSPLSECTAGLVNHQSGVVSYYDMTFMSHTSSGDDSHSTRGILLESWNRSCSFVCDQKQVQKPSFGRYCQDISSTPISQNLEK